MDTNLLDNFRIILVRPEFEGNIGSTARVMKNFGFRQLRLVSPPRTYKDSDSRKMAVGAFDILKSASVYANLADAIADSHLTVAMSSGRRRSRNLKDFQEVVPDAVHNSKANKISFVFGNERNGLLDEEIASCSQKVRIESSDEFPSLNLAQSVAVVCYTMSVAMELRPAQAQERAIVHELPSTTERIELLEQFAVLSELSGFSRQHNKSKVLTEVQEAYLRMNPTRRELALLKGLLFRVNRILSDSKAKDKPD